MTDDALMKINRAVKGIAEIEDIIVKCRPFRQIFEMNTSTGRCLTYAKSDDTVTGEITAIAFEVVQNLRTALDYAYWTIVSPLVKTENERKKIQFPFSETKARIESEAKLRFADVVSSPFLDSIIELKPYKDEDGNEFLYLIHNTARHERHRFPTPVADYKILTRAELQRMGVPGFPLSDFRCGGNGAGDVAWRIPPSSPNPGWAVFADPFTVRRELDVAIGVTVDFDGTGRSRSLTHALRRMSREADMAVRRIRAAGS